MDKWITQEQLNQFPELTAQELVASAECAVAQVKNNLPAFEEHFPAANSENNFYTPGINTDWTSGFWTGEIWLAYENAQNEADRALFRTAGDKQVDLRIGGKGYVIAACSVTQDGTYKPSDRPIGGRIPELTPAMVDWLDRNGYTEREVNPTANTPALQTTSKPMHYDNSGTLVPGTHVHINPPVMSEHNTHDAWVAWCYGIAKRASEQRWDLDTITQVFRFGISFVPTSHDKVDTLRCVQDACEKAGIPAPTLA